MINNLSLFDLNPLAIAPSVAPTEPRSTEPAASVGGPLSTHPALAPDVLRVIVPKCGKPCLAIAVNDGKCSTREFWLIQLRDGTYLRQWIDTGEWEPALGYVSDVIVERMLASEPWTEVRNALAP